MKTFVSALAVCTLVAGLAASQNPPVQNPPASQNPPAAQTPQEKTMPELTLTGCLIQGSTPSVFIFDNVKKDPPSATEVPVKYIVVAGTEDLNLRENLNHEVRITGTGDGRVAPPAKQKAEEKDLPKLTAKSLTSIADTCSTQR